MSRELQTNEVLYAETWFQDEDVSVAFITLNGLNRRILNRTSDITYEITSGNGEFTIGDGCVLSVQEGHKIFIPAGTQYQDSGNLMMLATAKPPFKSSDVEYLSD